MFEVIKINITIHIFLITAKTITITRNYKHQQNCFFYILFLRWTLILLFEQPGFELSNSSQIKCSYAQIFWIHHTLKWVIKLIRKKWFSKLTRKSCNKRPMGHINYLGKHFNSINTYEYHNVNCNKKNLYTS